MPTPTTTAITPADLMTRLYVVAADSMEGRLAGTPGGARATAYVAAELERLGLQPAGDGGTYFQNVPLGVRTLDPRSTLIVDGAALQPWKDYLPRDQGRGVPSLEGAEAVYGGTWESPDLLPAGAAAGRLVVLRLAPGADGALPGTASRADVTARFPRAAAIAIASLDDVPPDERAALEQPLLGVSAPDSTYVPAYLYVTAATAERLLGKPLDAAVPGDRGRTVRGRVSFVDNLTPAPARNVVAILPGSDPALRGEYVAIGAHSDHVGIAPGSVDHDSLRVFNRFVRPGGAESPPRPATAEEEARVREALAGLRAIRPPRADSISNGADDDGSGTVAVLEIAEALAADPPARSTLFVWHTAEEMGLLGAEWFTDHPTVPRDSIVAQLNIDMIGRGRAEDVRGGGPGYLQLIGSRRLSTELGDLVERVNQEGGHGFRFDYQYDADGHPQNYYCRSDHYLYARHGIPIVFFTTGGHRDYHEVTDEPQYIDYEGLTRVSRFIADVAAAVADLDHRVVVDKPKPDPDAPCQQ
ncbi:MAG TPA: M28 family peptidase [Gemmatimonadota bacterium]